MSGAMRSTSPRRHRGFSSAHVARSCEEAFPHEAGVVGEDEGDHAGGEGDLRDDDPVEDRGQDDSPARHQGPTRGRGRSR